MKNRSSCVCAICHTTWKTAKKWVPLRLLCSLFFSGAHIFVPLCSQTLWFNFRWDYITTMGVQEFFYLPVLLFMLVSFHSVVTQYHRDTREVSIFGKMLQKHIFKTITGAAFGDVCLRECYRDVRCQSFNYVFTQDKCELNNRTKEARPEDFVPNSERYYFRRDRKRGER